MAAALTVVAGTAVAVALARGEPGPTRWPDRGDLVAGVPWATVVVAALVVTVYAVVQRAAGAWQSPLVVPFTSWSYAHPVGVVVAPFAHAGPTHLVDNLVGLVVFGVLVEAAVGHRTSAGRRSLARAAVGLPLAAVGLGVVTSAFAWGPTVGSSWLVFALAGLAAVWTPVAAVVAFVAREGVAAVLAAVRDPVATAAWTTASGPPWWVDVAVQGHAFGLLAGVALGAWLARRRGVTVRWRATAGALWLVAAASEFWAVWWPSPGGYTLYRGLGMLALTVGAPVVALAARAVADGRLPDEPVPDRLVPDRPRRAGLVVLIAPLVAMAAVAVPVNAATGAPAPAGGGAVEVRSYTVTYAEDVPDRRFGRFASGVRTSGVVVADPDRGVWTTAVTAGALASDGTARVRLGGLGWDRRVFALREGWRVAGGNATYRVSLHVADGGVERVFASGPALADPVVAGRRVTVDQGLERARVLVSRNGTVLGAAVVPGYGESVAVAGLEVRRVDDRLVAVRGTTRVTVAWRE